MQAYAIALGINHQSAMAVFTYRKFGCMYPATRRFDTSLLHAAVITGKIDETTSCARRYPGDFDQGTRCASGIHLRGKSHHLHARVAGAARWCG